MEVILFFNSCPDYEFQYSTSEVFYDTFPSIINIFRASQVKGSFRFDSVFSPILFVFGQCWLSLRAIISIIRKDKWLLDGCFRRLDRLSIGNMRTIFNSNLRILNTWTLLHSGIRIDYTHSLCSACWAGIWCATFRKIFELFSVPLNSLTTHMFRSCLSRFLYHQTLFGCISSGFEKWIQFWFRNSIPDSSTIRWVAFN